MANYVLLYSGGQMAATPEAQAASMQAWGMWFGELGTALVDGGKPFTGQVKSITAEGATKDGPIGTPVSGYTIIQADSLDAALRLAKGCPLIHDGGQISVYETGEM